MNIHLAVVEAQGSMTRGHFDSRSETREDCFNYSWSGAAWNKRARSVIRVPDFEAPLPVTASTSTARDLDVFETLQVLGQQEAGP